MYKKYSTEISWKYVNALTKNLSKPVIVIGGWAVYFIVKDIFKRVYGKDYLGSKDLDLGYELKAGYMVKRLKSSIAVN